MTRALFRKLHNLFTETVSNPFYKQGQPLSSKKLDTDLGRCLLLRDTANTHQRVLAPHHPLRSVLLTRLSVPPSSTDTLVRLWNTDALVQQ
jgi:hypothetical protein